MRKTFCVKSKIFSWSQITSRKYFDMEKYIGTLKESGTVTWDEEVSFFYVQPNNGEKIMTFRLIIFCSTPN